MSRRALSIALRCHGTDRHHWRTPHQLGPTDVRPLLGIDFSVPFSWERQTPARPRPTRRHLPWRTVAPPAPPSESPYHRWELSIVLPRLIIYSNRVGLEPNLPLTRLLTHNPQTVYTYFRSLRNVFDPLRYIARSYV
jgi:hypothetical protein